ncbi:MAG: hypothetical protein QM654_01965 [Dysgonamonadaceae bacterium]
MPPFLFHWKMAIPNWLHATNKNCLFSAIDALEESKFDDKVCIQVVCDGKI